MSSRPTFNAAKATESQGGYKRYVPSHTQSVYLVPSHTVLKTRQIGQNSEEEIKHKDLKKELQEREELIQKKKNQSSSSSSAILSIEEKKDTTKVVEEEIEERKEKSKFDDSDDDLNSSSSDDSDSDSDDSDNEELVRELEKLRSEKEKKERLATQERALTSNPLLKPITSKNDDDSSFTVKRKWTDSTIFKNQANDSKQQKKKRYVNDTTRNDYHKQFMYENMK